MQVKHSLCDNMHWQVIMQISIFALLSVNLILSTNWRKTNSSCFFSFQFVQRALRLKLAEGMRAHMVLSMSYRTVSSVQNLPLINRLTLDL